MRILLVEDEPDLAEGLLRALRRLGQAVDWINDGNDAEALLRGQKYDLVILDLSLPGMDGMDILKALRARGSDVPVLVVTARDSLEQRVAGLDYGADDYLTKPFDLRELEARVRALLRRGRGGSGGAVIRYRSLALDTARRSVSIDGEPLLLRPRELGTLEVLLANIGRVVSKESIAEHLFSFDDEAGLNAVELYIARLRKKLSKTDIDIRTIRGLGYLLEPAPAEGQEQG
ncbi:response regulator transcription factor [Telmatospirillum sp. J64-1]|uniref:response regulator transcription factor n=1 Tax=Telmatospirillum sp. J64-1 TaxID=2502183 RepID=UPI00115C5198|nr:response regulator transcription factor [Telmatospirillum sp. J64-1]